MAITANGLYSERARAMFGMAQASAAVATTSPTAILGQGLSEQAEVLAKVASYTREQVLLLKHQIKLLGDIRKGQSTWGITDALMTKLFSGIGGRIFGGMSRVGTAVGGAISGAVGTSKGLFRGITSGVVSGVGKLTSFLSSGITGVFSQVTSLFGNAFKSIPTLLAAIGRPIMRVFASLTTLAGSGLSMLGGGLIESVPKMLGILGRIGSKLLLPLTAIFTAFEAFKGFTDADKILGRDGVGIVGKLGSALSSAVNGLLLGIPDWISDKLGFNNFAQMVDSGGLKLAEFTGKIVDAATNMVSSVTGYVTDFVGSITSAIGEAWEAAKTYVASIGTYIKDSVAGIFGLGPSKVEAPVTPAPRGSTPSGFNSAPTPQAVLPGTTTTGPTLNIGGGIRTDVKASTPTTMAIEVSSAAPSAEATATTGLVTTKVAEVLVKTTSDVANNAIARTNEVAMTVVDAQDEAAKHLAKTSKDTAAAVQGTMGSLAAKVFSPETLKTFQDLAKGTAELTGKANDYLAGIASDVSNAMPYALSVANGSTPGGPGGFTGNGGAAYAPPSAASGGGYAGGSGSAAASPSSTFYGTGPSGTQNPSGRPGTLEGTILPGIGGAATGAYDGPVAEGGSPVLVEQRKRFYDEMAADPKLRETVMAIPYHENSAHPEGILEAMFNRAASTGKSLKDTVYSGFYGPLNRGEVKDLSDPKKRAAAEAALERVRQGSNDIDLRTDQGMVNEHKYADSVARLGPDRGRKAQIHGEWYSDMGPRQEAWRDRTRAEMIRQGRIAESRDTGTSGYDALFKQVDPGSGSDAAKAAALFGDMSNQPGRRIQREQGLPGEFNSKEFGAPGQTPTTISLPGGKRVSVNPATADRFKGYLTAAAAGGYKITDVGGYNYRSKIGGGGLSQHAFGTAVDVNVKPNDYHAGVTDKPIAMEDMGYIYGISPGRKFDDAMHHEAMGKKAWDTYLDKYAANGTITREQADLIKGMRDSGARGDFITGILGGSITKDNYQTWDGTKASPVSGTSSVPSIPTGSAFDVNKGFGLSATDATRAHVAPFNPSQMDVFKGMSGIGYGAIGEQQAERERLARLREGDRLTRETVDGTIQSTTDVGKAIGEGVVEAVQEKPPAPSFTPVSATDPMMGGAPPVAGSNQTQNPQGSSSSGVTTPPSARDIPSIDEYSMLMINSSVMA